MRITGGNNEVDRFSDIVLLIVDCLRTDHLSRFGYEWETTPFLDSIEAFAFPQAVTTASWTYPAVSSILSGRYVHEHNAGFTGLERGWDELHEGRVNPLPSDIDTLPEIFERNGWTTFCHTAIKPVEMAVGDRYGTCTCIHHAKGAELVDEFLASWDEASGDTGRFAHVHFGDIHGWDSTHEDDGRPFASATPFGEVGYLPEKDTVSWDNLRARNDYLAEYERLYDTQLRYVDDQIRRLVESLSDRGQFDDTLVVVLGDHGEAFGEHFKEVKQTTNPARTHPFGVSHGGNLFEEVLNVPLLILGTGETEKITRRVSIIDLFPTVLDWVELPIAPRQPGSGISLRTETPDRRIYAGGIGDGYQQQVVYSGQYKLIKQFYNDETLLYNLETDPDERQPIDDRDVSSSLEATLQPNKEAETDLNADISNDTRRQLEDLGYRE